MNRFPLFAKGVERYRYEYAVFLLNKNIEMVSLTNSLYTLLLSLAMLECPDAVYRYRD